MQNICIKYALCMSFLRFTNFMWIATRYISSSCIDKKQDDEKL